MWVGKCIELQVDLVGNVNVLKSNFLLCDLNSLLTYLIKITWGTLIHHI